MLARSMQRGLLDPPEPPHSTRASPAGVRVAIGHETAPAMNADRGLALVLEVVDDLHSHGVLPDPLDEQAQDLLTPSTSPVPGDDVEPDVRSAVGLDHVVGMADELPGVGVPDVEVALAIRRQRETLGERIPLALRPLDATRVAVV